MPRMTSCPFKRRPSRPQTLFKSSNKASNGLRGQFGVLAQQRKQGLNQNYSQLDGPLLAWGFTPCFKRRLDCQIADTRFTTFCEYMGKRLKWSLPPTTLSDRHSWLEMINLESAPNSLSKLVRKNSIQVLASDFYPGQGADIAIKFRVFTHVASKTRRLDWDSCGWLTCRQCLY